MQLILGNDQRFLSIYPGTAGKETSHACKQGIASLNGMKGTASESMEALEEWL